MNLRSVAPERQDGTWVAQAQRIPKSPSVADFADKSKFFATFQVYAIAPQQSIKLTLAGTC